MLYSNLVTAGLALGARSAPVPYAEESFDMLNASQSLEWHDCYERPWKCALLEVPLDYFNESAGTTEIAFVKYPASNSDNAEDVLYNPGGPGDSGIDSLRFDFLDTFRSNFGDKYNLVSFDPRGTYRSGPYRDCERALKRSGNCSYDEEDDLPTNPDMKYANSVATVYDMQRYIEVAAAAKGRPVQDAKIWYIGYSYGTLLGQMFAHLFPDRIERMLLDGITDGERWFKIGYYRQDWEDWTGMMESYMDWLTTRTSQSQQAETVLTEFWPWYERSLRSFVANPDQNIFDKIQLLFQWQFSAGGKAFSEITDGLLQLMEREGSHHTLSKRSLDSYDCIVCNDRNRHRRPKNNHTLDWYAHTFDLENPRVVLGIEYEDDYCADYKLQAPPSQIFRGTPSANKTSNPILFMTSLLDPNTAHRNALKVAPRFGGSGLLVQNSVGHGTWSAKSTCTTEWMRHYFETGEVVPEGTRCDADGGPFGDETPTKMEWAPVI